MIIIFGSGLYGKVDEVPQMWHVATRFGHLWYIPLVPLGSYLVLDKQGENFHGIPVALSVKSVLTAWLRAGSILAAIGFAIAGVIALLDGNVGGVAMLLIVAAALATLIATYKVPWFSRASYELAKRHGEKVGLSDQGRLMLEVIYGRKSAAEADAELERIEGEVLVADLQEVEPSPPFHVAPNPHLPRMQ